MQCSHSAKNLIIIITKTEHRPYLFHTEADCKICKINCGHSSVTEPTFNLNDLLLSRLHLLSVRVDDLIQVSDISCSSYYQLRQLWTVVRCLLDDATKMLVHAFIASRLDYCNALFFGIRNELFCHLQSVQNAAARSVTGAKRSNHISPVLRQLHWLPVRQRVVFKLATLVHRFLSGLAPGYLADDCQLVTDARARLLRSADTRTLTVHRTSSCFGDRTFAVAARRAWNSLPADLRKAELPYSGFRRSLKTFLFRHSDHGAL